MHTQIKDPSATSQSHNSLLFHQAANVIPGGVNSPVRAFGAVGGTPAFIKSGKGAWIIDEDNTQRIDMVCSWGPLILGHAHEEVISKVKYAADNGLSCGAPTQTETLLAEEIRRRVPVCEKVRFVSTGTEATMTAIRLARGYTKRNILIKFSGCYHGHSDGLLGEAGSGIATGALPSSAGVPEDIAGQTIVLPYNDTEALTECFEKRGDDIAGVIVEGAAANMGVIAPLPGFYTSIRQLCTTYGALMIMDEVLTGFRVSPAGWWGLHTRSNEARVAYEENMPGIPQQEDYTPDLFCFGKVVGGGMPLAALGGRSEIMDFLAPLGPVYQAGTLSGNPLSTIAGLTTLRNATDDVYRHIALTSSQLCTYIKEESEKIGLPLHIGQAGSLFSLFFSDKPVTNYKEAKTCDTFRYTPLFWQMFNSHVYLPPSVFEAWFLSSAHKEKELDIICDAIPNALRAAADAQAQ
ncbi:MAG: glutamate-1-semialdehyde 2,1-aminomutase [Actinomycetaceae bacterium]|nr:glutamate-1-semialdehyde 2,1-aminomutase [Actinomycetaceae bacterium]